MKKLGHNVKLMENIVNTLEALFNLSMLICFRIIVLMISRLCLKISNDSGHKLGPLAKFCQNVCPEFI